MSRDTISEEAFEASVRAGSPKYLIVIAEIGAWTLRKNFPSNPPEWALEACKSFEKGRRATPGPVIGTRKGPAPQTYDGAMLDEIADLVTNFILRRKLRRDPLWLSLKCEKKDRAGKSDYFIEPSARSLILFVLRRHDKDLPGALERLQRLWRREKDDRVFEATKRFAPIFKKYRQFVTRRSQDKRSRRQTTPI